MVAVDHICIFFARAVSCVVISGSSVPSTCKCCKGAAGHGRLPVFYIVQTSFVNAQGKSWTGERMIETTRQKHIEKMPGCRVSRHPGISSQITGQAASVQHSVRFPLPSVAPVNLPNSIHWMIFMSEGCRETRHPFESGQNSTRLITVRNTFPYYRTHLFNKCVRIFVAILSPGGYIKIRTHKSSIL